MSEWVSESCSVVYDSLWPHGLYSSWNSPDQKTGVGSLLQGIFPTQGLNPGLPHCRKILLPSEPQGSPRILEWVAYPFSSRSSWPRNQTGSPALQGGFFTNWAMLVYMPLTIMNTSGTWITCVSLAKLEKQNTKPKMRVWVVFGSTWHPVEITSDRIQCSRSVASCSVELTACISSELIACISYFVF